MPAKTMSPKEKTGIILILIGTATYGLFPVFVKFGTSQIPPITLMALGTLLASVCSFFYLAMRREFNSLKNRQAWPLIIYVAIFVVIIPYTLFSLGAARTSNLNTSMLLLSEIIFTLIFTHFIGEKTTILKIAGSGAIFIGALFLLYQGEIKLNLGDALIILSTATYPIGNFFAKKALNIVTPSTILFSRFLLGGMFMLLLARIFEPTANIKSIVETSWLPIVSIGIITLAIGKIFYYEALKRLDISKTIALGMTFPLFSLLIIILFFKETIGLHQSIGIAIMMLGVYLSVKRPSVDPQLTKYRAI